MSTWEATEPYNALPLLPPDQDIESKDILRQCIGARAALAELKRTADLIPNQSMLINTLPLMEAQASSEIENIVTTTDHLFRHVQLTDSEPDPATKEALQYRTALFAGFQALRDRPLCTQTAELVCSEIKGRVMSVRQTTGTALRSGAYIIYTPPVGEALIRDKLANWEQFIHGEEIDPLIVMAVAHYQFEAIHPFADGNGRTGRILNSLLLIEKGLLSLPILYLSRYIIANKADYYRLLLEVTRDGHWEAWIRYILRGVEETALWTTAKIEVIRLLSEHTREYVQTALPAIYSRELLDLVFSQPYTRIGNVEQAGIAKRQTAAKYLKALAEIGVLQEISVGREKLFTHPKLLQLLREDSNQFTHYFS